MSSAHVIVVCCDLGDVLVSSVQMCNVAVFCYIVPYLVVKLNNDIKNCSCSLLMKGLLTRVKMFFHVSSAV